MIPESTDLKRLKPTWAPRVTQREIRRLYETDAMGIYDEGLINEVGYGLLLRCRSFIDAVEATRGKVRCPGCSTIVTHSGAKEELLRCDCGWELSWGEYLDAIRHKQLSGNEPVLEQFRAFVAAFPAVRTPQERMILIDQLIHGFHWYYKGAPTRPVAINLIEGRLGEVVAFLEKLSHGEKSTPGVAEHFGAWEKNIDVNRSWYPSRRKGGFVSSNAAPDPLARHLRDLEESLLQPDVRKSEDLVALLADDFIEFGSSGRIYTKKDLVATLQAETPSVQTTSGFQVSLLAPGVALLTYVIRREADPPVFTLRSSVWQLRGELWQMVFHQATFTAADNFTAQ